MTCYDYAKMAFENYLDSYNRSDDKIRLKIVHTYGVVDCSTKIASRIHLPEEEIELARLIALLHDIGRFEQLKRFNSFLPETMDHASYGVTILFEEGLIREFIPENTWDDIIRTAIACHSLYKLENHPNQRIDFHSRLIRDADKLDNCRVKLDEPLETFMDTDAASVGASCISPAVEKAFFNNESVLSSDRVTPMDYWVSYMAYYFDINFRESLDIIEENDFVVKTAVRIPYTNADTAIKMNQMVKHMTTYIHNAKRRPPL